MKFNLLPWRKAKPVEAPDNSVPMDIYNAQNWRPERCPITMRPFFMWIEHPEHGMVPTYGGPFDSYTIPEPDNLPVNGSIEFDDIEMSCHHFDHDDGAWKDWVEGSDIRLIKEAKLLDYQPDLIDLIKQGPKRSNPDSAINRNHNNEAFIAELMEVVNE